MSLHEGWFRITDCDDVRGFVNPKYEYYAKKGKDLLIHREGGLPAIVLNLENTYHAFVINGKFKRIEELPDVSEEDKVMMLLRYGSPCTFISEPFYMV